MPYLLASGTIQKPENVEWFANKFPADRAKINDILDAYTVASIVRNDDYFNYFLSQENYDQCMMSLHGLTEYQHFKTYNEENNIIVTKYPLRWVDEISE